MPPQSNGLMILVMNLKRRKEFRCSDLNHTRWDSYRHVERNQGVEVSVICGRENSYHEEMVKEVEKVE